MPDIYAIALGRCAPSGVLHIYQAKHSCLCYNLYIYILVQALHEIHYYNYKIISLVLAYEIIISSHQIDHMQLCTYLIRSQVLHVINSQVHQTVAILSGITNEVMMQSYMLLIV